MALASFCVAGVALTACSQGPTPGEASRGTVTGRTFACVNFNKAKVIVDLTHGSRTISRQTVEGAKPYRFLVPAGNYVLITNQKLVSKPVGVAVRAGQTTHADIPSLCA
jgi:hypothetical protein